MDGITVVTGPQGHNVRHLWKREREGTRKYLKSERPRSMHHSLFCSHCDERRNSHIQNTCRNFTEFSVHVIAVTVAQLFFDDSATRYVLPVLWIW